MKTKAERPDPLRLQLGDVRLQAHGRQGHGQEESGRWDDHATRLRRDGHDAVHDHQGDEPEDEPGQRRLGLRLSVIRRGTLTPAEG